MELNKQTTSLLSSGSVANNNEVNRGDNASGANGSNSKGPLGSQALKMGNAAQLQSPMTDGKQGTTSGLTGGYGSNPEAKGFAGANGPSTNGMVLGMGGQGRLGLDSNGNALTVHKRPPKEETV